MSRKIVVALGGNAILSDSPTAEAQKQALVDTAEYLVQFIENGDQLIITHGNGPQVGNLLLQNLAADSEKNPAFPLDTLVAMTEGSIGYWLQTAMQNALAKRNIDKPVASVVTQVIVDKDDPAFNNPTKPIGPFYSEEEAKALMANSNDTYKEDAGRGWRKVVASPKPIAVKEIETVRQLVDAGQIVIAGGGGGIPVVEIDGQLEGREAVIDKDFASQVIAQDLNADVFIILTGVDHVFVNFNQPNQKQLDRVNLEELQTYMDEGQFAAGSMLPKIQASMAFVQNAEGGEVVITSLDNIKEYIASGSATVIQK